MITTVALGLMVAGVVAFVIQNAVDEVLYNKEFDEEI